MRVTVYIADLGEMGPGQVQRPLAALLAAGHAVAHAIAVLYRPDACVVARVTTAQGTTPADPACIITTPKGAVDVEGAYEMLVFHPDWEMRWVREGTSGRAKLVTEEAQFADLMEKLPLTDKPASDSQKEISVQTRTMLKNPDDVRYLLWGKRLGPPAAGWLELSDGRIGSITVPIGDGDPTADDRLESVDYCDLKAIEYFVEDSEHGNVTFGFQRCIAIVPFSEGDKRG